MPCDLLWNSTAFFLYRCDHNISCKAIDQSLYICSTPRQPISEIDEPNASKVESRWVNKTSNTTYVLATTLPMHTSLPLSVSTTTINPNLKTTTGLHPTTTNVLSSTTVIPPDSLTTTTHSTSTTTRKHLRTTTEMQTVNLTTTQTYLARTTHIPLSSTTTGLTQEFKKTTTKIHTTTTVVNETMNRRQNLLSTPNTDKGDDTVAVIVFTCIFFVGLLLSMYIFRKQKKKRGKSNILPVTEEEVQKSEEQELEETLRINAWRMQKLHQYLDQKHPEKKGMIDKTEEHVVLMEKINIQIKNSPKRHLIYRKRGQKKKVQSKVPTMKVDFNTMMKEPKRVKHISSIAKLKIKMLPAEYEHRRKRKNFKPLKKVLLPVSPPTRKELDTLKKKKLVSNSVFFK